VHILSYICTNICVWIYIHIYIYIYYIYKYTNVHIYMNIYIYQEEYDISVQVLLRELNVTLTTQIKKERDQKSSQSISHAKAVIKSNEILLQKMRDVNTYDIQLYLIGLSKFCHATNRYPDLFDRLGPVTKLKCTNLFSQ
jgi:hypothetical protein